MTFDELRGKVVWALMDYRRHTGQDMRTEHLALDIHPEDWDGIAKSAPLLAIAGLVDSKLYGIALLPNPSVEAGHPRLRSTWSAVL